MSGTTTPTTRHHPARRGPLGRARRLDVGDIRGLRLEPVVPPVNPFPPPLEPEVVGPPRGEPGRPAALAFDCAGKTWRFGAGQSEVELATARAALADRLPAALSPRTAE